MQTLEEGTKIELESGRQYEILKVFDGNICDIKELKPTYPSNIKRTYFSVKLVNYKIIKE